MGCLWVVFSRYFGRSCGFHREGFLLETFDHRKFRQQVPSKRRQTLTQPYVVTSRKPDSPKKILCSNVGPLIQLTALCLFQRQTFERLTSRSSHVFLSSLLAQSTSSSRSEPNNPRTNYVVINYPSKQQPIFTPQSSKQIPPIQDIPYPRRSLS